MGCSGSKKGKETLERPGQLTRTNKLKVWGDFFNADTRMIIAILRVTNIKFDMQKVDTIKGENTEQAYRTVNPSE